MLLLGADAGGFTFAQSADAVLALLTAARTGDVAGITQALAAGAKVDAIDPNFSQTALIRAAMFGQTAAARTLLAAGARTDIRSDQDRTALHWASVADAAEVISTLVAAGAAIDPQDAEEETPLGVAAREGSVAAARALVRGGARPDRMRRPLAQHLSLVLGNGLAGGQLEVLQVIIQTRRGLEVSWFDRTALLVAAEHAHRHNSADIARALLAAGARPDARNKQGQTAVEEVRESLARMIDPASRANLEAMLQVLTGSRGR